MHSIPQYSVMNPLILCSQCPHLHFSGLFFSNNIVYTVYNPFRMFFCFHKKKTIKDIPANHMSQQLAQSIFLKPQKPKHLKFCNISPTFKRFNVNTTKNRRLLQYINKQQQLLKDEPSQSDQFTSSLHMHNDCPIKISNTISYTLTDIAQSSDEICQEFTSETSQQTFSNNPKKNTRDKHTLTQIINKKIEQPEFQEINHQDEFEIVNHKRILPLQNKPCLTSQQVDVSLNETLEEAQNSFYCKTSSPQEQFTRAIISSDTPELSKRIYSKMTIMQKNTADFKGYTPIQLLILKAIKNHQFLPFAKEVIYDPDINLQCKGPTGWTPLQEALFYRNIPLATHIFKSGYTKKQLKYQSSIEKMASFLQTMEDFYTEISIKIDSFLPLIGNFTPSDTLKIKKQGKILRLDYTLVGYQFPSCKRRDMSILFDGKMILAINNSKNTYCNLLEPLEHDEMVLMIEDLITGQMKKSQPIVHSINLIKKLSLFQNEIVQQIGQSLAVKHVLELCYTSTTEKRKSKQTGSTEELLFINSYASFVDKKDTIAIKQKNRNKKIQLQVWLSKDFGLRVGQLSEILSILSMGNNLINEWSKFLNKGIGQTIQRQGFFPLKIDIPLSYSLYFNIEFISFQQASFAENLQDLKGLQQIPRRQFQNIVGSREKRAVFLQAFT